MLGAGGLTRLPELLLRVLLIGVLLSVCVMFAAKNPSPAQLPWRRSPPVEASLFHSEILKVFRLCVSFPLQHKALGLISSVRSTQTCVSGKCHFTQLLKTAEMILHNPIGSLLK